MCLRAIRFLVYFSIDNQSAGEHRVILSNSHDRRECSCDGSCIIAYTFYVLYAIAVDRTNFSGNPTTFLSISYAHISLAHISPRLSKLRRTKSASKLSFYWKKNNPNVFFLFYSCWTKNLFYINKLQNYETYYHFSVFVLHQMPQKWLCVRLILARVHTAMLNYANGVFINRCDGKNINMYSCSRQWLQYRNNNSHKRSDEGHRICMWCVPTTTNYKSYMIHLMTSSTIVVVVIIWSLHCWVVGVVCSNERTQYSTVFHGVFKFSYE